MVTQQLLDYIRNQKGLGQTEAQIRQALAASGWPEATINEGFGQINNPGSPSLVPVTELPKAREIFKQAWEIYKSHFKTLITISLVPALAMLILVIVFVGGIVGVTALKINLAAAGIAGILIGIAAYIFVIYLSVWAAVAQLQAIKDQAENIGFKEAYKRSRANINPFFFTGLLTGLAVIGGFILLIVPGIIFSLWFSQSPYIVVEEGLKNTAAMKKSKFYVKGRIGTVFGKLFYMGIISFGIYIGIAIILAIVNTVGGIKPEYTNWLLNVFSWVWGPLVTVYGFLLYKHLKASRPS